MLEVLYKFFEVFGVVIVVFVMIFIVSFFLKVNLRWVFFSVLWVGVGFIGFGWIILVFVFMVIKYI